MRSSIVSSFGIVTALAMLVVHAFITVVSASFVPSIVANCRTTTTTTTTTTITGSSSPWNRPIPFAALGFSEGRVLHENKDEMMMVGGRTEEGRKMSPSSANHAAPAAIAGLLSSWGAAFVSSASAAGPDWGIFEGRTGSLLHPVVMGSLLLFSLYTGFLGFQWRRQRTMGDEISSLRKSLPDLGDLVDLGDGGARSAADILAKAKKGEEDVGVDDADPTLMSKLETYVDVESRIASLTAERKELSGANPRDRHFNQGALLAFLGTAFAIEGPLNTYARAGKLFPGPHLYAGAGLVVLWALAASCVPRMQRGDDAARIVHIGANMAGIGLFGWQVVSGIPILLKVIEKTQWP